jgi:hypothetical protein
MNAGIDPDFPPQIRCARCENVECEGCEAMPLVASVQSGWEAAAGAQLAWETPTGCGVRGLWSTACQSVNDWPERLPKLAECRSGHAWMFALLSELLATLSVCGTGLGGLWLFFPSYAAAGLSRATSWQWLLGAALAFALAMLALHALWALGLEALLLLRGKPWSLRATWCFALYACGWDLLTSPAGLLLALSTMGPRDGWLCVKRATIVPKLALDAYLVQQRGVSRTEATRLAVLSFCASVLVLIVLLGSLVAFQLPPDTAIFDASRWDGGSWFAPQPSGESGSVDLTCRHRNLPTATRDVTRRGLAAPRK